MTWRQSGSNIQDIKFVYAAYNMQNKECWHPNGRQQSVFSEVDIMATGKP